MEKRELRDPDKPAWEIVTELGDDDHPTRNDGIKLTPANDNLWYQMMTVAGESEDNHEDNLGYWMGWLKLVLSNGEKSYFAQKFDTNWDKITDLSNEDIAKILTRIDGVKWPKDIQKFATTNLPQCPTFLDLSNLYFKHTIHLHEFLFPRWVVFSESLFEWRARFNYAQFGSWASFNGAQFRHWASFNSAQFGASADFKAAQFGGWADFDDAQFGHWASFHDAQFGHWARFNGAQFRHWARFNGAQFREWAIFNGAQFEGFAEFDDTIFSSRSNFQNVKFKNKTRFLKAKFEQYVPEFYGAEFHPDIHFFTDPQNWPKISDDNGENITQKNAYNALRQHMEKLGKVEEEQFFHRQEMRCEKALADKWYLRAAYGAFETLSDYGWSITRPLAWLAGITIAGWFLYWEVLIFASTKTSGVANFFFAGLYSLASTFPSFGAKRQLAARLEQANDNVLAFSQANLVSFISMIQTGLGIFFLFLLALALRNRFRLR